MFGHAISLNFEGRDSSSYKTMCGGVCSIILKGIFIIYFLFLFKQVLSYENDTYLSHEM